MWILYKWWYTYSWLLPPANPLGSDRCISRYWHSSPADPLHRHRLQEAYPENDSRKRHAFHKTFGGMVCKSRVDRRRRHRIDALTCRWGALWDVAALHVQTWYETSPIETEVAAELHDGRTIFLQRRAIWWWRGHWTSISWRTVSCLVKTVVPVMMRGVYIYRVTQGL